jgi:hypothetical protein
VNKRVIESLQRAVGVAKLQATPNPDVIVAHIGEATMVIIAPDASGFVITSPNDNLAQVVQLGQQIGLQTITSYVDVANLDAIPMLQRAGLRPTMLRMWQEKETVTPEWQVGWRATMNQFGQSLHYLRLHPEVEEQVSEVIASVV